MPVNTAAWLRKYGAPLEIGAAPYTTPRENEIVVKNRAVAVNPIDWILQAAGNFAFPWMRLPFVLGADLAGDVVEVGASVTRLRAGDRVLAHAVGSDPKRNGASEGSFQRFTVVLADMASPIPSDMSYERACVVPLGLSTAACGLFGRGQLALELPAAKRDRNGQTLLVWGGSTSVGSNAIELAVAAGYEVVATASPRNFDYVKALGASRAFDYRDRNAVRDIVAALAGKTLAGALAVGAGSADRCVEVVGACAGAKVVSMATFPLSFAHESGPELARTISRVLRFVWFNARMWLKTRPRGIRTSFIFGSSLIADGIGRAIYVDFLPGALAESRFTPAPEPRVVGNGLHDLQAALDLQRKGVSATKIVVSLPPD